ncbi:ABC transporter ATP-binding protein [Actinomadura alba]|uniref:ABC transporter ATP-binding protein n=1 Tax=Actinomadura alba TaxID=406431 RepID=A0ABR7LV32_9ACTN|nr:ABC transporter ATP-binding protein [Actinomadura alba]MBC6468706.1 ABC transporter ATP-binding protein [Actinomadura alba]
MTSPPALLELRDVTVRFGGLVALDGVSFDVPQGRVTGVIGPNGAGKTTVFNVICGFVRPDEGRLRWRGEPLTRHRPHDLTRLGIARTLQGLGLFPGLTVVQNVMVGAERHARAGFLSALFALPRSDRDEAALRDRAMRLLTELGVAEVAGRFPGELPYGVQKRVALARALVAEPDLVLLDEPAAGLSAGEIDELAALIRGLRDEVSVVLVEHHMDLVMEVCDDVVVLDFGRLIARGSPDDVRDDPLVVAAYLGDEVDDSAADELTEGGTETHDQPSHGGGVGSEARRA